MNDARILTLYENRSEAAVSETERVYGAYCMKIAMNILGSREDAEECVNDAFLLAWKSIPPTRPAALSAYLGRLTRNLALNRYKQKHTNKRGKGETALLLSELEDCVSAGNAVEDAMDARELSRAITGFLYTQDEERRAMFVRRYWYADSIADVARRFGAGQSKVKSALARMRKELKDYLEKEGIHV
jgi:RNA polymerase sigma-70 factor (ECF subfamily)